MFIFLQLFTYIHHWSLQPFSQGYWPSFSHYLCCVWVNFIYKWRDLQFTVNSERQIFCETFHGNFIYSQSFCQKPAERKPPKKYFSWQFYLLSEFLPKICWENVAEEIFSFLCPTWGLNPGFKSNNPTYYLLDYGDFIGKDYSFYNDVCSNCMAIGFVY